MNFSALAASDKNVEVSEKEVELTNAICKSRAYKLHTLSLGNNYSWWQDRNLKHMLCSFVTK